LLATIALASGSAASAPATERHFQYLARFPHFSANISKDAPGDIDTSLETALAREGKFVLIQREFELYAWQLFASLNWPGDGDAARGTGISAPNASVRWENWVSTASLKNVLASLDRDRDCNASLIAPNVPRPPTTRHLKSISTMSSDDLASIVANRDQDTPMLVDQNRNFVYYESLVDPNQVYYLCARGFLSREGKSRTDSISFPAGSAKEDWSGSYSIKLAWKVLDTSRGDDPSRYLHRSATILDLADDGHPYWHEAVVGLVGMHIAHKTESAPERIWATFEQIDNLDIDRVAHPGLRPAFFDPACVLCAVNSPAAAISRTPTQVARALPISAETQSLNAEAASVLAAKGSVLRYYRLIGVQWPGIAGDIASATPAALSNAVMETFNQPGPHIMVPTSRHQTAFAGGTASDQTVSLANTQASCMACHALAPSRMQPQAAATAQAAARGADFSWFLSLHLR
jgi:hypothetical protein